MVSKSEPVKDSERAESGQAFPEIAESRHRICLLPLSKGFNFPVALHLV